MDSIEQSKEPEKFPWNGSNLVLEEYKKDNIKIERTGAKTGKAIIFFSSNGVYFPDTEEVFYNSIVVKDRYEFENISRDAKIQNGFELIIFIRDVYKQWCVNGINDRINTLDKLCEHLKELAAGYELTTCGCSAGGYLSMILGNKLGAEKIFSFSGQFYLWDELENGPLLEENKSDESKSRYYDITPYLKNGYYFYPATVKADLFQFSHVKENDCIKKLAVAQKNHGSTVSPECYPYLLTMSKEGVDNLFEKFKNAKKVRRAKIDKQVLPLSIRLKYFPKNLAKSIVKALKKSD